MQHNHTNAHEGTLALDAALEIDQYLLGRTSATTALAELVDHLKRRGPVADQDPIMITFWKEVLEDINAPQSLYKDIAELEPAFQKEMENLEKVRDRRNGADADRAKRLCLLLHKHNLALFHH